jgi:hypothetical protein
MTGNGPYAVTSAALDAANGGRGVAPFGSPAFSGQVFFNPVAGTVGSLQRRMFDGPNVFNADLSLIKNTKLTEKQSLEFRMDAFNVLNHPAFASLSQSALTVGSGADPQNINNPIFGQIGGTVNDRRVLQFGLNYQF